MNAPIRRSWDKVELFATFSLLVVLATVLVTRLSFAEVWKLPPVDLVLTWMALGLTALALWLGRTRRWLRIGAVAFGAATQLVPMVVRQPVLILPLLGAIIPVIILAVSLALLSRKRPEPRSAPRS
ncbi:MAG: LrgA [Lysobacterales bacterium 14-68-21]|nr:MAG: LrgA [Xanthomonadales bacterium 15-68-25]OZB65222.1 MAG: LrgA [Xanthomonadales bacterium 14-68-21]